MRSHFFLWIFIGCCAVLTFLWLPGLRYPVVSDTAIYAELGESLWKHGAYIFRDAPFARHPPLHAFLSYPLVALAGVHVGMKLASLLAGFGVLLATFFLLRRAFGPGIALGTVVLLTFHHAFVLMTQLGSADLLFASLFLGSLAAYAAAADDRRHYLTAGALAGLATVTRYNGAPLIPLFLLYTFWRRRRDLTDIRFLAGVALSILPLALWFLRSQLVFGSAFHSDFTGELEQNSAGAVAQLLSNIVFYLNPLHNILPILFVTALYGIARHGRQQELLLLGMLSAWVLTAVWWVQAMRFAFPGYPILLGFGILGLTDLWREATPRHRTLLISASVTAIALLHGSLLCFYAYGQCNALVDRLDLPGIPKSLGLTPEGFYAWSLMRDEFNRTAAPGSTFVVDSDLNGRAWVRGVFRSDIRIAMDPAVADCPFYRISQSPPTGDERVVAKTDVLPVTYLTMVSCPRK